MMGERTVRQEALFCGFSLENHVPADHLLIMLAFVRPYTHSSCGHRLMRSAIGRSLVQPAKFIAASRSAAGTVSNKPIGGMRDGIRR